MNRTLTKKKSYIDITKELLSNINKDTQEPIDIYEYIKLSKNNYNIIFNEKNAIFDKKGLNQEEKEIILKIREIFGWNIGIIHRINMPNGIRTPDIRNLSSNEIEYWDIKNIKKVLSINSRKNKIKHVIESGKGQTINFILNVNNKNCNLTNKEIINQIDKIYQNPRYLWVNKIILLGDNNYIKVFKRK